MRRKAGNPVTFNGETYWVYTKEVASSKAGSQALETAKYGVFIATAAPRLFDFSPLDFAPYTDVDPPIDGDTLQWMAWEYLLTHPDAVNVGNNTQAVFCYGYRLIGRS